MTQGVKSGSWYVQHYYNTVNTYKIRARSPVHTKTKCALTRSEPDRQCALYNTCNDDTNYVAGIAYSEHLQDPSQIAGAHDTQCALTRSEPDRRCALLNTCSDYANQLAGTREVYAKIPTVLTHLCSLCCTYASE